MKLEQQVVSLKLAKELKKAGYKQEGLYCWHIINVDWEERVITGSGLSSKEDKNINKGSSYLTGNYNLNFADKVAVAPTVAELGEVLPDFYHSRAIMYWKKMWKEKMLYFVTYDKYSTDESSRVIEADTEADARAKMWLYLKKEGLL